MLVIQVESFKTAVEDLYEGRLFNEKQGEGLGKQKRVNR